MAIQIKRKLGQPTSDDLDGLLEGQPLIDLSSGNLYIGGSEKRVGESLVEQERQARQTFENSHDNIENAGGIGIDSIIQKYSGEQDATHNVNTNTGESAAVFGELNSNTKNRTLVSGKMNISNASNSIIGGLGNGRNNVTSGNPAEGKAHTPQLYGSCLIVGGQLNHSFTYGDGKSPQNSIISGQSNILDGGNNCLIVGLENRTYRDHTYPDQNIIGGNNNKVYSMASLVVGHCNVAKSSSAIIAGYYNEGKEDALLELGNGTASVPSNAFTVYKTGNVTIAGNITSPTITIVNTEISRLDSQKANKATTLSGYGITNAYSKSDIELRDTDVFNRATQYTNEKIAESITTTLKTAV